MSFIKCCKKDEIMAILAEANLAIESSGNKTS